MKRQWLDTLYNRYGVLVQWFGLVAGGAAFVMMFLVFADIVGRKFFNSPIEGVYEVSESLLTIIIYLGVAYTQHERGHVRVTLLTDRLKPKVQIIILAAVYFIGFLFFVYVAYCMFCFAADSWRIREMKWGAFEYPLYPIKALAGVGMFLMGIQFLLDSLREVFLPISPYQEIKK